MGTNCNTCEAGKHLLNGKCFEIRTSPRVILKSAYSRPDFGKMAQDSQLIDEDVGSVVKRLRQRLSEEKRKRENVERMMQLYKSKYEGLKRSVSQSRNKNSKNYLTVKRYG